MRCQSVRLSVSVLKSSWRLEGTAWIARDLAESECMQPRQPPPRGVVSCTSEPSNVIAWGTTSEQTGVVFKPQSSSPLPAAWKGWRKGM